jgi:hypothetical protein
MAAMGLEARFFFLLKNEKGKECFILLALFVFVFEALEFSLEV